MVFLGHVAAYFLDHVGVVFAPEILEVDESEVETFWLAVFFVEVVLIEHGIFEGDWFSGEDKSLTVDI